MTNYFPTKPQVLPAKGKTLEEINSLDSAKSLFLSMSSPSFPLKDSKELYNKKPNKTDLDLHKKNIYRTTLEKRGKSGEDREDSPTPTTQHQDPRFADPEFKAAVRKVLTHLGYAPTFGSFKKHDAEYNSDFPIDWVAYSQNIGISSNHPEPGIYFETHTGKLIEMGKCLNSIQKLTEFNRRSTK